MRATSGRYNITHPTEKRDGTCTRAVDHGGVRARPCADRSRRRRRRQLSDLWRQAPGRVPRLAGDQCRHEAGDNNDIRAILGNDIALKAYREGTRPFPDGAIIARVAWQYVSSPENDAVFGQPQSFVAGAPTNVQISVKDAKRYAETGGWGYGQFENSKPNRSATLMQTCALCHARAPKGNDLVFTHYSQ